MIMTNVTAAARSAAERERFAVSPPTEAPQAGAVTVRLARDTADTTAMIDLGRRFHAEGPYFRDRPYDDTRLVEIGRLGLAKGNPGLIMAERGGQLVGMAIVVAGEQFYSGAKAATVQLLYVAPEARGGSAAVKLLRAIRRWAETAGTAELHLHVTSGIDAARTDRFLRRMGFKQTGGNYVLERV